MPSPLVSVVIPVFNGARFLSEAIDSILAQEHRPLEVIVVDDGSTDDSAVIAERFGEPVRVLRPGHRGAAAARNAGVAAAAGTFVAFLDCDDVWLPGKLAVQLELLRQHPEVDLCVTWTQNFWEPELAVEAARYIGHPMSKPYGGYTIVALLGRTATIARVAGFPEHLRHGECVVWFETARQSGAVLREIPQVFVRRRLHAGNMTRVERDEATGGLMAFLQHRLRARRHGQP